MTRAFRYRLLIPSCVLGITLSLTAPSLSQERETVASRIDLPGGFTRVPVERTSLAHRLRHWALLPDTTPCLDWQGREVFQPSEIAGVLEWRRLGAVEQCADIAIRLVAEHAHRNDDTPLAFRSLSGQEVEWKKWLQGRYYLDPSGRRIHWTAGRSREVSSNEFESYLKFVMTYANTASLMRDWVEVDSDSVRIGDALIQPHCSGAGMGHLSVVFDACASPGGEMRFLFVDGYTPARMPVVRLREIGQLSSAWMTIAEYLELQSRFGHGSFYRFSGP